MLDYLDNIPDISDLIAAYESYNSDNYWDALWDVMGLVIDDDEIQQIINYNFVEEYTELTNDIELVKKAYRVFNLVFTSNGGQLVLSFLPDEWKNLPGSKLVDGEGLYYKFNTLRIMNGNPDSPYANQQVPYLRVVKGSVRLDKFGNSVQSNDPNFQELTHIPLSEITIDFLIKYYELRNTRKEACNIILS